MAMIRDKKPSLTLPLLAGRAMRERRSLILRGGNVTDFFWPRIPWQQLEKEMTKI